MSGDALIEAARIHSAVRDPDVAHLVIGLNKVMSARSVKGLDVATEELADGVRVRVALAEGTIIEKPVHMCFGLLQETGVQKIYLDLRVGARAEMSVIAHCVFPNASDVKHFMDATIVVGEGARYSYFERHIHSDSGGVDVRPTARVTLAAGAHFKTEFELIHGRAGKLDIAYETRCAADAVMEMTARVAAAGDDVVKISETGYLEGDRSRGALVTRVALKDAARAEVRNTLIADGDHATGHVDCKEIVLDHAVASAVPIVQVNNPKARVTHEAAIGSVDNKQLETLMSRGLTEDEASGVIVQGLLS